MCDDQTMPSPKSNLPTSLHFHLEMLHEGVYAALTSESGAANSNAGIIDLGDQTLVFDTFNSPLAAQDLRKAAEHFTGRAVTWVINSHSHADHWFGNQMFGPETPVIATHAARVEMAPYLEQIARQKKDPSELQEQIRLDQQRLETETDEQRRSRLQISISRTQNSIQELPSLALRLPDQTFEGKLYFHGSWRTAELNAIGHGHTSGDCILFLPDHRAAFLGDLAFFAQEPFMSGCDLSAWLAQIDRLAASDYEIFVPGHGPLGTKADLVLLSQYLKTMYALVSGAFQAREPVEQVIQQPLPEPFSAWMTHSRRHENNVKYLYQQLGRHNSKKGDRHGSLSPG